jgi:hypothetical protein
VRVFPYAAALDAHKECIDVERSSAIKSQRPVSAKLRAVDDAAAGVLGSLLPRSAHAELQTAAAAVKDEHHKVGESLRAGLSDALVHAIAAGEKLSCAKRLVRHGEWGAWVARELPEIDARTERLYRHLADASHDGRIQSGIGVTELSIRKARELLAGNSQAKQSTKRHEHVDESEAQIRRAGSRLARVAKYLWTDCTDGDQLSDESTRELARGFAAFYGDSDSARAYCGWLRESLERIEDALAVSA